MRFLLFLTLLQTLPVTAEPLPKEAIRRFPSPFPQVGTLDSKKVQILQPTQAGDARWVYDSATGILQTVTYGRSTITERFRFPADAIPPTVSLTRDERYLLSDSALGVDVWKLADGKKLRTIFGIRFERFHTPECTADGERIVFHYRDPQRRQCCLGSVRLRDGSIVPFEQNETWLGMADGNRSAIVESQTRLSIVDPTTGKELRGMEKSDADFTISPTQDFLLAADKEGVARYDLATFQRVPWLPLTEVKLAISPDGKRVAVTTYREPLDQPVVIHALDKSAPIHSLLFPEQCAGQGHIHDWQFTPDGQALVCQTSDLRVRIDGPNGSRGMLEWALPAKSWPGNRHAFLAFRTDDELLTIDTGRLLEARSISTGQTLWSKRLPREKLAWQAVLAPTGDRLAVISHSRPNQLIDNPTDGRLDWIELAPTGAVVRAGKAEEVLPSASDAMFSADGKRLLTAAVHPRDTILVWDAKTGRLLHQVKAPPLTTLEWHRRFRMIVALAAKAPERVLYRFDDVQGEWIKYEGPAGRDRWDYPYVDPLWTMTRFGLHRVYCSLPPIRNADDFAARVPYGTPLGLFAEPDAVPILALRDQDNYQFVTPYESEPIAIFPGTLHYFALSQTGRRAATMAEDGSITVWDIAALRARNPFKVKPLTPIEWSAAWNRLATEDSDASLQTLAHDPEQTLREIPKRMPVAQPLDAKAVRERLADLADPERRATAFAVLAGIDVRVQSAAETHARTLNAADAEAVRLTRFLQTVSGTPDHIPNRMAFRTIELLNSMRADALLRQYAAGDAEAILTLEAKHALERRR